MSTVPERSLALDFLCRRLAVARDRVAVPMARVSAIIVTQSLWHACSYARASDFAHEQLRRGGRWLGDMARLHAALCEFPALATALCGDDGKRPIGRVAALRIGRIASTESVDAWIARARNLTVRELTAELGRARKARSLWPPGSEPPDANKSTQKAVQDEGDDDVRANVVVPVPGPVLAAFEETLDLHRAVVGREALVAEFVDALTAESVAAGDPHARSPMEDVAVRPVERAREQRLKEEALARATNQWSHLLDRGDVEPGPGTPDETHAIDVRAIEEAVRDTLQLLSRLDVLEKKAGTGSPARLVRQVRSLIKLEEKIESQLGTLLSILSEIKAWHALKFTGVGHYGAERLRMSRTKAEDRARLARGLRAQSRVRRAYDEGRVGTEAALLLCRLFGRARAHEEVQRAWIERAAHVTIQRLRDEIRVAIRCIFVGPRAHELDSPELPAPPDAAEVEHIAIGPFASTRHRAHDDSDDTVPDTGANDVTHVNDVTDANDFTDAHANSLSAIVDRAVPDESAATQATEEARRPADPNSVPFPVADRDWQHSLQRAPGDGARRITKLGAMACERPTPDVFLRLRLPDDVAQHFVAGLEEKRRQLEAVADQAWDDDTWDTAHHTKAPPTTASSRSDNTIPSEDVPPSTMIARMFGRRARRPPTWVALLAMLEEYAHTWDQAGPRRPGDAVYIRAGWRCTAPGCTSRKNLEDHHIVYRSRGGSNDLSNRTCICRFHHQHGEHGGLASVRGKAPLDIVWRLGRGELAQWYRNDRLLAPVENVWAPEHLASGAEWSRTQTDPKARP